jgi:hypothetical protein
VEVAIGMPRGIAADGEGNVYFSTENQVLKVDASGQLHVVAGDGFPGFSGDGGLAIDARLDFRLAYPDPTLGPYDYLSLIGSLAIDRDGNLLVADSYNGRVRRIDRAGIITTVAGPFGWLNSIAADRAGNLFVGDYEGPLWKVTPAADRSLMLSRCLGREDWEGAFYVDYTFGCYSQVAATQRGGAYLYYDCGIFEVGSDGRTNQVVGWVQRGLRQCGYAGDQGPASQAIIGGTGDVAVDPAGNLLILDSGNGCVRRVDRDGIITAFAGTCGRTGYGGDGGCAREALFYFPYAFALAPDGTLYIADTWNRRIRAITPDGVIRTVAGNGK